ncbi:MAG: efflux RND transporter periplasmic adaptor subunit [Salibacter sp.]|uniref:efflux RND transporter periplasmic adaptor subunit n=1 Tax=Salibacter sp. TaxID=2010995 RepID=UPI00286FDBD3|nr:efflux RND transporter periplasmic adaptor subunit [Salibacter sp.]MDR9397990.1 efflux RND transporter periplasmic adaptor subunit [Salibacter sp.]
MKKKKYWIIGGVILIILIVLAVWKSQNTDDSKPVLSEEAKVRNIIEKVSANGKIQPEKSVDISPEVPGEIIELPIKEGQKVKKGDLLAKINPDIYIAAVNRAEASLNSSLANAANSRARLEQAKARLINARNIYNRQKKLFDDGVISQQEFDQTKADYDIAVAEKNAAQESLQAANYNAKSAEASVKEARDNLERTTIKAPIDGTVAGLQVEQGERVVGTAQMSGTKMMLVADLTEMEVNVEVNESDIVRVKLGDEAEIEVDAYTNRTFKGVVTEISNASSESASSSGSQLTVFEVKVRILRNSYEDLVDQENPHLSPFRPGMNASVEIFTDKAEDVLAVPIQAVTVRPDSSTEVRKTYELKLDEVDEDKLRECVFLIEDGKAVKKFVETGIQDNKFIEIRSGLEEGQTVVTGPYSLISKELTDGDAVSTKSKMEVYKKEE